MILWKISGLSCQKKGRKSSSPSNWSPTHHRHPHSDPHCYISCMEHLKPNLSVKYRVNFCTCLRRWKKRYVTTGDHPSALMNNAMSVRARINFFSPSSTGTQFIAALAKINNRNFSSLYFSKGNIYGKIYQLTFYGHLSLHSFSKRKKSFVNKRTIDNA